jgi:hypothetical protein
LTNDLLGSRARARVGMPSPLVMATATMDRGAPSAIADLYIPHLWLLAGFCAAVGVAAHVRLARLLRRGC